MSGGADVKKYEYVQIHIGRMDGSKSGEIRQAINDYAAKGFRYAGFVPVRENDRGRITGLLQSLPRIMRSRFPCER